MKKLKESQRAQMQTPPKSAAARRRSRSVHRLLNAHAVVIEDFHTGATPPRIGEPIRQKRTHPWDKGKEGDGRDSKQTSPERAPSLRPASKSVLFRPRRISAATAARNSRASLLDTSMSAFQMHLAIKNGTTKLLPTEAIEQENMEKREKAGKGSRANDTNGPVKTYCIDETAAKILQPGLLPRLPQNKPKANHEYSDTDEDEIGDNEEEGEQNKPAVVQPAAKGRLKPPAKGSLQNPWECSLFSLSLHKPSLVHTHQC